mgnify:CR=1 FL=1
MQVLVIVGPVAEGDTGVDPIEIVKYFNWDLVPIVGDRLEETLLVDGKEDIFTIGLVTIRYIHSNRFGTQDATLQVKKSHEVGRDISVWRGNQWMTPSEFVDRFGSGIL